MCQALARAVYARADIVLFDDVLSALDAKTERLVVDRLLGPKGLLRKLESTVLLVTHASMFRTIKPCAYDIQMLCCI